MTICTEAVVGHELPGPDSHCIIHDGDGSSSRQGGKGQWNLTERNYTHFLLSSDSCKNAIQMTHILQKLVRRKGQDQTKPGEFSSAWITKTKFKNPKPAEIRTGT